MKELDWGLLPVSLTGITAIVYVGGVYGWDAGGAVFCVLAFIFTCFCYFSMNLHIALRNKGKE